MNKKKKISKKNSRISLHRRSDHSREVSDDEWPKPEQVFHKELVEFPKLTNQIQFFKSDCTLLPEVSPPNCKLSCFDRKSHEFEPIRSELSNRNSTENQFVWRRIQPPNYSTTSRYLEASTPKEFEQSVHKNN